jgi:hypothetical protein
VVERRINPRLYRAVMTHNAMATLDRQPICAACYWKAHPEGRPFRVLPMRAEVCHVCDRLTTMGIYVRVTTAGCMTA